MSANQDTPLHTACIDGKLELANFLADSGADVSIVNNYGDTPLHYACINEDMDIAKFLVDRGSDVSALNKYGWKAFELLSDEHQEEMEKYASCLNFGVKPAKG
jgi:ankyrin repeat protein